MSADLKQKEVLNEFIFSVLLPLMTRQECPTKLNLLRNLVRHLCDKGVNAKISDEIAVQWLPDLLRRFLLRLEDWGRLGVPFPCCQSEEKKELFITWRHPKYQELTGLAAISESFICILRWIESLSPREFLLAGAAYLKVLGATRIFITDGPRDGGIDLLGKIERTPFNSIVFFVQAKTADLVTRDTVLMEYGKYLSLPHEEIFHKYRDALDIKGSADGVSYCYSIVANCEFHNSAKEIASKIGILLRSKIQIAYFLSQVFDIETLNNAKVELKDLLRADLTLNIANRLPIPLS